MVGTHWWPASILFISRQAEVYEEQLRALQGEMDALDAEVGDETRW